MATSSEMVRTSVCSDAGCPSNGPACVKPVSGGASDPRALVELDVDHRRFANRDGGGRRAGGRLRQH